MMIRMYCAAPGGRYCQQECSACMRARYDDLRKEQEKMLESMRIAEPPAHGIKRDKYSGRPL